MVGCSYNSIVCLYDHQTKDVLLWNPYIHKSITLPKPYSTLYDHPVFGLGFVDETSDYKVLLLNHTNQAELYSLQRNCWKIIANPGPFSIYDNRVVCVKGSLYWISRESNTGPAVLHIFDLKDEVFGEISLPDCWNGLVDSSHLCLLKYNESSIVVHRNGEDNEDYDVQVIDVINEKKWRKRNEEEEEEDCNNVSGSPNYWIGSVGVIYSNEKGENTAYPDHVGHTDIKEKKFVGRGIAYNYVTNLALLDKADIGESSIAA